ncbi:uncharacterized protein LOC128900252 [Rissa tridactyla]|uniref:uncharacterized protein LOC128900252 n=1 Tax=Rissa tridactyla TaxID=75485 RepID=UPI0023BA6A28|nr:uncharacterized protein LOC128900252 [Rissa tridactyla]
MLGKALPRANKRPGCANPARRVSPGRYLGSIWPLFTCPLESALQTSSSHSPDKAKEPRSALRGGPWHPGLAADTGMGVLGRWRSPGDALVPAQGSAAGNREDPNRVSGDLSTPDRSPNPVNTSAALSIPGAANRCPGSGQGGWVPFQECSGRSWHPHRCLSFPFGRVHLPRTSLPDPRRWLLRHAGTCHHAGRGPRRVRARPLRCLTQAGPCLPVPLPAPSKADGIAQPLRANSSHPLLCPGRAGTKKSPTHSCPTPHLALRSYIHPRGQGDQQVPGRKRSPMVEPLGPTSSFLGAAKETKDPQLLPAPSFAKGSFQHSLRDAGGWMEGE